MVLCGEVAENLTLYLFLSKDFSRESVTFNSLVNFFLFTATSPLLGLRYPG